MAKYKVLAGGWGEGYKKGDIFEAEYHAVQARIEKGEVEEVKHDNRSNSNPKPKAAKKLSRKTVKKSR